MTDEEGKAWRESRRKVPEGYRMTTWPAFRRLMDRLGVPIPDIKIPVQFRTPDYDERVCIEFRKDETVKVSINGRTTDTGHDSFEAYRFAETKAYCRLLGIPWDHYVLDLKIEFAEGEFPSYTVRAALAVPNGVDPEKE